MCTVATIVYFLGYMPPRGSKITVYQSQLAGYSERSIERAKSCAARFGIKYEIVG